jgi:hypothetical protein
LDRDLTAFAPPGGIAWYFGESIASFVSSLLRPVTPKTTEIRMAPEITRREAMALTLCSLTPLWVDAAQEPAVSFQPTHSQTRVIPLSQAGIPTQVNTFCLDPQGRVLVAMGGSSVSVEVVDGERETETQEIAGEIHVYSQDGERLATWPLNFIPQSLNVSPDGIVFVAGAGQMARLDENGAVVYQQPTPQVGDMETFKQQIAGQIQQQNQLQAEQFEDQIEQAQLLVTRLSEKPEEERTAIDKLRLRNAERQLNVLQEQVTALSTTTVEIDVESWLAYKLKVPGLAVSDQDVFIACSSMTGYGYDIYRTDLNFYNPQIIVEGLSGCCGQMDIQCHNGELIVAENSRHRVRRFDREGTEIASFGQADRTGANGFEGCCNPMNIRPCSNGQILTAESGVGFIKRYSPEGEYVGLLADVELEGGCKHVAIAATSDESRVFMLDVTRSTICVLEPTANSPE